MSSSLDVYVPTCKGKWFYCLEPSPTGFLCSRPARHFGRHHNHRVITEPLGEVRAVWGPDIYAEARAKGRAS